jgi:hypothetical protein
VGLGSIARLAQGNEENYSLYRCPGCSKYFLDCVEYIFMSVSDEPEPRWTRGPFDKEKGELLARLITECPDPYDKYCSCAAHVRFFEEI